MSDGCGCVLLSNNSNTKKFTALMDLQLPYVSFRYADRVKELGAADPVKNGDADMEDIQEQSVSSSADSSILVVSRREDSHSDLAQLHSLNDGK